MDLKPVQAFKKESVEWLSYLDVDSYSRLVGCASDLNLAPKKVSAVVTKARELVGNMHTQRHHLQHIAKTVAANGRNAAAHAGQLTTTMSCAAAGAGRRSVAVNILGAAAGAASFCKQFSRDCSRAIAPPEYNVGRIGVQDRVETLSLEDAAHVLYPVLEARERQLLLAEAKVAAAASKDAKKAAEQAFRRHQQKALAVLDKIHAVFNEDSVEGILDLVAGMGDLDDACTTIRATLLEYGQLGTPVQQLPTPAADSKEGAAGGAQPSSEPAAGAGDGTVHVSRRPVPQPESKAA